MSPPKPVTKPATATITVQIVGSRKSAVMLRSTPRCTPMLSNRGRSSSARPADWARSHAEAGAAHTMWACGPGQSACCLACTSGRGLVVDRYGEIRSVARERLQVTVQAGCTIRTLNRRLAALGWALPNLGDIEYQTISGAVSTSTHGTGIKLGGLATQVVGLELVTGDGSVLRCSADEEPDLFACARVGLGALGVLSTVTLQCVPAFNLHAVEEPLRLDHVLENLDSYVEDNDHS